MCLLGRSVMKCCFPAVHQVPARESGEPQPVQSQARSPRPQSGQQGQTQTELTVRLEHSESEIYHVENASSLMP